MRTPAPLLALLTLLPIALAAPHAHTDEQTGRQWTEGTAVIVQANTRFFLAGALGDHDIFFYTATGIPTGSALACGADRGIVPPASAFAIIRPWDHVGQLVPQCLHLADPMPHSRFVYVDGL